MRARTLQRMSAERAVSLGIIAVSVDDVRAVIARSLLTPFARVIVPSDTPPALGAAVARAMLGAERVEFVGMAQGMPTYQRAY